MDDIRQPIQETRESGEGTENSEQQKLDDATFEPRSYVEQASDYTQAETIQNNLVELVDNAKTAEAMVNAVAPSIPGEVDHSKLERTSAEEGGDEKKAIPINIPGVQEAADSGAPSVEAAAEKDDTLAGREPELVQGVFEKASGDKGDDGGEDITPINLPQIRETAGRSEERIPQSAEQAGFPKEAAGITPAVLRSEKFGEGEIPAALRQPAEAAGMKFDEAEAPAALRRSADATGMKYDEAETPAALRRSREGITSAGEVNPPADTGAGVASYPPPDTGAGPAPETGPTVSTSVAGAGTPLAGMGESQLNEKALGEAEELTTPEWYVHMGPNGEVTVVDADGNPVDSPPIIQLTNPDGSACIPPKAYYAGDKNNPGPSFELPFYAGSLEGCSVYIDANGKAIVLDAGGKPLATQPTVQLANPDGTACPPKAYYAGDKTTSYMPTDLPYYSGSLQGCSVYIDANGKATVMDANGKPLAAQPTVQLTNPDGSACTPKAYYAGAKSTPTTPADLPYYSGSLQGCSVYIDAGGKATVMDASGNPLAAQPTIQLVDSSGAPCPPKAYYAGGNNSAIVPADLPYYSGSLEGCSVNIDANGKATVVDASGKPLAAQPSVQLFNDDGTPCTPKAYYAGDKNSAAAPVDMPVYSESLQGCSIYLDAGGKATVVDATGKPLAAQPIVQLYDNKGVALHPPKAYYSGNQNNPDDMTFYSGPPPKSS
jgi:hypothetical protein